VLPVAGILSVKSNQMQLNKLTPYEKMSTCNFTNDKIKKNFKQALGAFHLYFPHVTLHSEILYFFHFISNYRLYL